MSNQTDTDATSCHIIRTELVQAQDPSASAGIGPAFPLGPLDSLVAPVVPIAVCFIYPAVPAHNPLSYDKLKIALGWLLNYYPHLTGRLAIDELNNRVVHQLDTGAKLLLAECASTLDSFQSGQLDINNLPGGGNDLLPPFEPTLEAVRKDAILAIKFTSFACGAVSLGIRCLHAVCDGGGFFTMVRHLAELYSHPDTPLRQPPIIRPYLSTMSQAEKEVALQHQPRAYKIETTAATLPGEPTITAPVTGRVIPLSAKYLTALKERATTPGHWTSTYVALSAMLYQGVHRARVILRRKDPSIPPLSPPDFLTSFNLRSHLPSLPVNYFPNAVTTPITTFDPDELFTANLTAVAQKIHDLLHQPDITETDNALRWIAAQHDKSGISSHFRFGNGAFMIAQWSRFDLYGLATFDGQIPALVAPPFTVVSLVDGLGYTLPPAPGEEGLTLNLSLSEPLWSVIDREDLFGLQAGE